MLEIGLLVRRPVCDEAAALELDELLRKSNQQLYGKGRRRHFVDEPVIRLAGPLLPIVLPDGHKTSGHHPLGFGQNHH